MTFARSWLPLSENPDVHPQKTSRLARRCIWEYCVSAAGVWAGVCRINTCFTAGKISGVGDCHAAWRHQKTTVCTSIVYEQICKSTGETKTDAKRMVHFLFMKRKVTGGCGLKIVSLENLLLVQGTLEESFITPRYSWGKIPEVSSIVRF